MRLLVDTHCFLWTFGAPELLNEKAATLLADRRNAVFLSAASSWEIAIKFARGKLQLPEPPESYVPRRISEEGLTPLPIEHMHALRTALLPFHHHDPFDRLLISQAQIEELALLTADRDMLLYDVEIIWAGLEPPPRRRRRS